MSIAYCIFTPNNIIAMNTEKYLNFVRSIYKEADYYTKDFFYRWYLSAGEYYSDLGMEDNEIIGFLRVHPIDIARAFKYCPEVSPRDFAARHLTRYTVPETEQDAFRMLDEMIPLSERERAVQGSMDDFVAKEHFGLGMWIRNNWIYGLNCDDEIVRDRYRACLVMLAGAKPGEQVIRIPDDVSSRFLRRYYDHLKVSIKSAE